MPILPCTYVAPPGFRNGHVQTVYARLFRRVAPVPYVRERIITPDNDFLDLDWCHVQSSDDPSTTRDEPRLAVLCHGLEGSSSGSYIVAMARAVTSAGYDALAWNYRSCSGEMNRQPRYYHSGSTDDLHTVLEHALQRKTYRHVVLIGFSLGGNLVLKYAGERGASLDPRVKRVVAFSVPCDLAAGAAALTRGINQLYARYFMVSLIQKIDAKRHILPPALVKHDYRHIRSFQEFDDRFTAPLNGFLDAQDYWWSCSSIRFLPDIHIPALLVNARDDPFLAGDCLPFETASHSDNLFLEVPDYGGHLGFVTRGKATDGPLSLWWPEERALEFLRGDPPRGTSPQDRPSSSLGKAPPAPPEATNAPSSPLKRTDDHLPGRREASA